MRRSLRRGMESALFIAVLVMTTAQSARSDTIAFTFQDPASGSPSVTGNDGFQFQPNVDILVTALGYYDRDQEGLALTHAVGIYDVSSQSLLATTTVGPGSTLDGLFRYTAIDPLSLRQGRSYMVVGFHPGSLTQDLAAANPAGVLAASDLTYQGYFLNFDAALSFPTTAGGPSPFFGPNFKFAVDSVSVITKFDGEPPAFCSQSAMGWPFSHQLS